MRKIARNFVRITFAGDTKSLESAVGRVDKSLKGKLVSGAKVASAALLGGLAFAAKTGYGELLEAQKVSAQTAAVLKSTGGVANVTADQIANLSGALMEKSGVDDELIQSGANLLLTFKNIRNEAGKGNDVFNQATKATLDMSVAMGQDMKSSSILVGKALNDPIKGLSALTRVGITFTDAQKDQIKAMVAAGNTAGAQKIILRELESQFGGSAEAAGKTLAGQLNIAKETFNNLAGSLVGAVLPAFTAFSGILNSALGWLTKHQAATKVIVIALATLATTVLTVNKAIAAGKAIKAAYIAITTAWTAATKAQTIATKAQAVAQRVLNAVMKANPLMKVITLIALLAAAIVLAYKKSETFRKIVDGAFEAVKKAAKALSDAFDTTKDAIITAFNAVGSFLEQWGLYLAGPVGAIIKHWDDIRAGVTAVKDWIVTKFDAAITFLKGIPGRIGTALASPFLSIRNAAQSIWEWIKGRFDLVITNLGGIPGRIGRALASPFEGIRNAAQSIWTWVKGRFDNIITNLTGIPGRIGKALSGAVSKIAQPFIDAWNKIPKPLRDLASGILPGGIGGGNTGGSTTTLRDDARRQRKHTGGIVPGRFGQEVNTTLLAGEMVTPRGLVQQRGRGGDIHIHVNSVDPQSVIRAIERYDQRNGKQYARAYAAA